MFFFSRDNEEKMPRGFSIIANETAMPISLLDDQENPSLGIFLSVWTTVKQNEKEIGLPSSNLTLSRF